MEMMSPFVLSSLLSLACLSSAATHPDNKVSPAKPSFLFMLIDDIGWADFDYNGGIAVAPNLHSWLSTPGTVQLQDMHSGGTVCSPTRATVLTGRHHFRDCVDYVYGCSDMTNCVPNFEFAPMQTWTVGDAVRQTAAAAAEGEEITTTSPNPYEDGIFFAGKWHLGSFYNDSELYGGRTSSPITHGFDHFNATVECAPTFTTNCQCRDQWKTECFFGHYNHSFRYCNSPGSDPNDCCFNYWWNDAKQPHGVQNLTQPSEPDDALYIVDAFTAFLEQRHQTEQSPFLAQLSFHNCHIPFIGSNESVASCRHNETCRGPLQTPYTPEELDYYACLTQLDTAVGKVLDLLHRTDYYNNTLIWFASDNGPENNCPPEGICRFKDPDGDTNVRPVEGPGSAGLLRGRKRDIYEGGHRVPGIVSWPAGVRSDTSRVSWETVSTVDFLPTVMDALGGTRPASQQEWAMDGRSILPLLEGKIWKETEEGEREIGFGFYNPRLKAMKGWGFRYGKWKYVEGSASCKQESCMKPQLFDLEKDLGERHDLSEKEPEILKDLQSRFHKWHKSVMKSRKEESHCQKAELIDLSVEKSEPANSANVSPIDHFHDTHESVMA